MSSYTAYDKLHYCIISTLTIPDSLSKKLKPRTLITLYRPINNLSLLEKLVEDYIQPKHIEFLESNSVINDNHHGGQNGHSTTSTLLQIQNQLTVNHEQDKISVLLTIDLTAAFDTVNPIWTGQGVICCIHNKTYYNLCFYKV